MTTPLLLVGAGGLAREAAEAVRAAGSHALVGLLDDDEATWGAEVAGLSVLGPAAAVADHPEAQLLLCPGRGGARLALAERLAALGVAEQRWATVVHPAASVGTTCTVGAGSVLLAGAVLTADVRLGRHVVVMPGAVLTHDDELADAVTVCARVSLAGGVRVGSGAYLGAGALVREHLTVGEDAVLGMGAVVLADVPPHEVWVGNPARRLRAPGQVQRLAAAGRGGA